MTLAKLRLHATPTAERTHRRAGALNADNPYKTFFQHLYPDTTCFACGQKGIKVVENTDHMVKCPSQDDRKEASVELWKRVHNLIRENQSPNATDARHLRPFALRTPEAEALTVLPPGQAGGDAHPARPSRTWPHSPTRQLPMD